MAAVDPAEIRALDAILEELDYYQVLELVPGAPTSAIRSAYHRASRRFHPDGHRARQPELQAPLARISKRVAEAYSVLRDARRRQVYDRQLAANGDARRMPLVQAEAEADRQRRDAREGRTPNGRRYFALAQRDIAKGDRVAAERNLRTALTFEPDNPLFRETLAQLKKR